MVREDAKKTGNKTPSFAEVKYGHTNPSVVAADRAVGNLLEQLLPFLLGLYGYALLVDANVAVVLGWIWVALRAFYPVLFAMPLPAVFVRMAGGITLPPYASVLVITLPSYAIIWYMVGASVFAAIQNSRSCELDGLD